MSTLYDPLYAALVGGLIGAIGTWVAVVYQGRLNAKADQLAMKRDVFRRLVANRFVLTHAYPDGIVKLRLTAAFGAQHGGFTTGWSPVSCGSLDELFANLTMPARVENAFFRYKLIIGESLRARSRAGQETEAILACNILNQMTQLGRPASYAIGR